MLNLQQNGSYQKDHPPHEFNLGFYFIHLLKIKLVISKSCGQFNYDAPLTQNNSSNKDIKRFTNMGVTVINVFNNVKASGRVTSPTFT